MERKLYERDPTELGVELLLVLQRGLMSKLVLTNRELQKRYRILTEASAEMKVPVDAPMKILADASARFDQINATLEAELARGSAAPTPNSN